MIGFLTGTVQRVGQKEILVLTSGGVGYTVRPAGALLASVQLGKPIDMVIHTIVREQEISLYGFASEDEKQLFEKMLGVSGIGPKLALQIVSMPLQQVQDAVASGNVEFITTIPGIGKKMAQKLIVELQGKLDLSAEAGLGGGTPAMTEATEALVNLGYDKGTVYAVLKDAPQGASTEDLVKFFLGSNA